MATLTTLESLARDRIDASRVEDAQNNHPLYSQRQTVRNVFWAFWSDAMTVDCVEKIAAATNQSTDLQRALTGLVANGLLRSRMIAGTRHYELNLS